MGRETGVPVAACRCSRFVRDGRQPRYSLIGRKMSSRSRYATAYLIRRSGYCIATTITVRHVAGTARTSVLELLRRLENALRRCKGEHREASRRCAAPTSPGSRRGGRPLAIADLQRAAGRALRASVSYTMPTATPATGLHPRRCSSAGWAEADGVADEHRSFPTTAQETSSSPTPVQQSRPDGEKR